MLKKLASAMEANYFPGFYYIFLAVALLFPLGILFEHISKVGKCKAQWEDSIYNSNYTFYGGCKVHTKDLGWIPDTNVVIYRTSVTIKEVSQ